MGLFNSSRLKFGFILLLACSLLSACGFKLRGTGSANLNGLMVTIVSETPYGELEKSLSQKLISSGALLTQSGNKIESENLAAANQTQVILHSIEFDTQGVSRDSSGRANQIVLRGRLNYQLIKALPVANKKQKAESEISPIKVLTAERSYFQDYRNPVSEINLKKQARAEIINDLSDRLTRQLQWQFNH